MNVVIINGSYHKAGMVSSLINSFTSGLKNEDDDPHIKRIDLLDQPIEFCKGCINCARNDGKVLGDCSQQDGMRQILEGLLESDLVVFATPIYELGPTALMKRFMERSMPILYFDRRGPVPRNKTQKGKTGLVIVSSATPYPLNVLTGLTKYPVSILSQFCQGFGCQRVKNIKAGGMQIDKYREKFLKEAYEAGRKMAEVWNSKI
jgi:multimeric flavodoxin WrbA